MQSERLDREYDDAAGLRTASLAFSIVGSILFLPGVAIAVSRWKTIARSEGPGHVIDKYNAIIVGLTILFEDIPQLSINGVYMTSMGADTDAISILCMVASSFSLLFALCDVTTSVASAMEA